VPVAEAKLMASTQRPIAEAAFNEASSTPAWKSTPSWFIYGDRDLNIPASAHAFMAKRANSKETIAVKGASHVVMISHPDAVAKLIEQAAVAN
jgi:pimeloyl-ACP methyl ester carboxylesterase